MYINTGRSLKSNNNTKTWDLVRRSDFRRETVDRNIFQKVGVQRTHAEYRALQTSSLFWNGNSADNVSQPSNDTFEQRGADYGDGGVVHVFKSVLSA